jgi:hypothetical protein
MKEAPLRWIVSIITVAENAYARQEVGLECGHTAWCSAGVIYRTRCRKCVAVKEKP